jgi:peptidoglycan/LPS O-acetylase OafA/YrhL
VHNIQQETGSKFNKRPERAKIRALTSVRFFAALYVVFFHTKWGVKPNTLLDVILSLGYVSVSFFFLLSGYILATVYLRQNRQVTRRVFYLARFARIYPIYIASVLAETPYVLAVRVAKYGVVMAAVRVSAMLGASVSMMQMWMPTFAIINVPSWSLSIETCFYLAFPILGAWLWQLDKKVILSIAGLLYVSGITLNWELNRLLPNHVVGFDLASYFTTFALGILLARWQCGSVGDRVGAQARNWIGWAALSFAAVGFAIVVLASSWIARIGLHSGLLLAPIFATIIWVLSSTEITLVRVLDHKGLVALGEASYGLYLVHVPIMHVFSYWQMIGSPWHYPLYLGACALA